MPLNYHNELYSEGPAGLIDFVWLWYNRLTIVIAVAIFLVAVVLIILSSVKPAAPRRRRFYYPQQADPTVTNPGERQEAFVRGTNFKRLNRSRQMQQKWV